jgi:hypothetical protein
MCWDANVDSKYLWASMALAVAKSTAKPDGMLFEMLNPVDKRSGVRSEMSPPTDKWHIVGPEMSRPTGRWDEEPAYFFYPCARGRNL